MYSSVFVMAVCYVEKGGEPIFLGETEGVIIKQGTFINWMISFYLRGRHSKGKSKGV